jgi:hypothetical protein
MLGLFPGEPAISLRPALARRQRYIHLNISIVCRENGWTQAAHGPQDGKMPQASRCESPNGNRFMNREARSNEPAAIERRSSQHRCISCGGVIDMPADQDLGLGLNLRLGLVSDECALVCDACTSRLIFEKQAKSASSVLKNAKRRSP